MSDTSQHGAQCIVPYLYYEDGPAALDFLGKAFGFEVRLRELRDDGSLRHAEAGYDGNVVMLGTPVDEQGRARALKGSARHGSVMCTVDDVDAHHARARDAGATITLAPMDRPEGQRLYSAVDPEGHEWHFASRGPGG